MILPIRKIPMGCIMLSLIVLPAVITGCYSMYPLDDSTREFLERIPGAACSEAVAVDTGADNWIAFDQGTACFQRAHGHVWLIGGHSGNSFAYIQRWDSIPSSKIHKMVIEQDAEVKTFENAIYDAKAGEWEIEFKGDSSWTWHASRATLNSD